MQIGQLAKNTGVAAHTIRFYESKGLLPRADRGANGYRSYKKSAIERLALIQFGQRLGFNLEELLTMFGNVNKGWDRDRIMDQLSTRLKEIEILQKTLVQQKVDLKTIQQRIKNSWESGQCMCTDELSGIITMTQ